MILQKSLAKPDFLPKCYLLWLRANSVDLPSA